jgi:hypothetical protein
MEETIPRRLARFNRNQNSNQQQYSYDNTQPPQNSRQNRFNYNQTQKEENFEIDQIKKIPSMDYNDVNLEADKKNIEELKKIQEKNLVEKLALEEVEKFKVQNKRMPNSKEEEQIAESLYTQLKKDSFNTQSNNSIQNNPHGRNKRRNAETQNMGQGFDESVPNTATPQQSINQNSNSQVTDIKDLFGDNENDTQKNINQKDEFDMDIGEVSEIDSIENKVEEELERTETNLNEKSCPNCKKKTEKVIYCPKCGAAFCTNCAKIQGKDKVCPKCGAKIKI